MHVVCFIRCLRTPVFFCFFSTSDLILPLNWLTIMNPVWTLLGHCPTKVCEAGFAPMTEIGK